VIIFLIFLECFTGLLFASEKVIKRDIDNDGMIDQKAYVGEKGKITRLELYNSDNRLTAVQYYDNDYLLKVEKDTDKDGIFDITDYFEEGKRIRQEKNLPGAAVMCIIVFDENEKITEIKKDTNKDGTLDQHFFYKAGVLISSTCDETGDGNVNVWKTFQDKQVIYKKTDENGDGLPEKEIFYNQSQVPEKSLHDLDSDGYLETLRLYSNGALVTEKKDLNQDNVFDLTIEYKSNQEVVETQDSNFDGVMDRTVFFDSDENPLKIVLDTNGNGVPDQWQQYENDSLKWFESDRNDDGKTDLKIFYIDGEKQRLIKDDDFNEFFEITQKFDQDGWNVVIELDSDENKIVDLIFFYTAEGLSRKDMDENGDGRIDFREYYDSSGRMIKSEEAVDGAGCLNLAWYYDQSQTPVRAEKDADADGRPDIWYYYMDSRLTNVREDTNNDGKPDVWEEYGAEEEMLRRSRDLNFDGIPDIKEDFTKADSNPEANLTD